jgi:hypothetical protein
MTEAPEVVIFLGPTLPRRAARAVLEADYRPPVGHGDVWRALESRPKVIGVIDGVFEHVPAVWHKELLQAMAEGVHVFGASSMGALRAAELHAFGMRGVGRIFEAYRDGHWLDDDEVAITHGPAETGWVTLCEPMANVRFTLEAALAVGAVDARDHAALTGAAKAIHYVDRDWKTIVATADLARERRDPVLAWLQANRVDQKRADAIAMLEAVRDFLTAPPGPMQPGFVFERTDLAEHARRIALAR